MLVCWSRVLYWGEKALTFFEHGGIWICLVNWVLHYCFFLVLYCTLQTFTSQLMTMQHDRDISEVCGYRTNSYGSSCDCWARERVVGHSTEKWGASPIDVTRCGTINTWPCCKLSPKFSTCIRPSRRMLWQTSTKGLWWSSLHCVFRCTQGLLLWSVWSSLHLLCLRPKVIICYQSFGVNT